MLAPYVIARSMFDEFFDSAFSTHTNSMMRTDIQENDQGYLLTVDLPGVKKENLAAELKDGYLCINATIGVNDNDSPDNWRYLRRERLVGAFRRSFYVGDKMRQEDIQAKFEDGILRLFIPKEDKTIPIEAKNIIAIEG